MLVACRLAGLSALGAHYGASNEAQCRARLRDALVTPAGILAGSHPLFARALARP